MLVLAGIRVWSDQPFLRATPLDAEPVGPDRLAHAFRKRCARHCLALGGQHAEPFARIIVQSARVFPAQHRDAVARRIVLER